MPGFKLALLTWPQGHSQKNDSKTIISKVQVQVNNKCEVDTEALQKRVLRLMASLFSKKKSSREFLTCIYERNLPIFFR